MPKHKKKGPLTLQGAVKKQLFKSGAELPLKVLHRDSAATGRGLPAFLHPSSIQQLLHDGAAVEQQPQEQSNGSSSSASSIALFLQLASGSDCVLHARASSDVPLGSIHLDEVQQANLRLCAGEVYKFSVFQHDSSAADGDDGAVGSEEDDKQQQQQQQQQQGQTHSTMQEAAAADDESEDMDNAAAAADAPFELTDLDCEVRLLHAAQQQQAVQVDAVALTRAFCKQCCWRVLAVNEYVVVELPGVPPLLLRVTTTNTLTADEQQDALGYHCFRGLLTPDTTVYMATAQAQQQQQPSDAAGTAAVSATQQQLSQLSLAGVNISNSGHQQQQQHDAAAHVTKVSTPVQSRVAAAAAGVQLLNAVSRAAAPPATNVVHVYTNDGEWFPVKKKLLRPCIALTKAVRDSGDTAPTVHVDIDTLTFDRLLIFLEAQALQRQLPGFAIHYLDDLQRAGEQLGLRSLQEYCAHLKGTRQAALGVYSFADVQRANASGKVWLLLDGMVLDVGRWLPEHPGGATIIPAQSLNCDCSRFFEMYHASRESFLYIAEFYIGELVPEDLPHVPLGGKQPPSSDFLAQLREYTAFRQPMLAQLAQRTPVTHLGAGKARSTAA